MKTQMVTFWEVDDIRSLDRLQLEDELRCQKWLYRMIQKAHSKLVIYDQRSPKVSWVRLNKIDFCEVYMKQLQGFMAEIEYFINKQSYPKDFNRIMYNRAKHKDAEGRKRVLLEKNAKGTDKEAAIKEGINLQWDKEKFLLVAKDRGYRTEEAVTYAVKEELDVNYEKAKVMVNGGRFTWGQVMLLGAKFEMTPKEFCDIFMAGYFLEEYGEYRASYKNIDRSALLKRRILPSLEEK